MWEGKVEKGGTGVAWQFRGKKTRVAGELQVFLRKLLLVTYFVCIAAG